MDTFTEVNERCQQGTFLDKERLWREPRRSAAVVVGIVNIVRVELDLVVVEVEVGRLREDAITVWILLPPVRSPKLEDVSQWKWDFFSFLSSHFLKWILWQRKLYIRSVAGCLRREASSISSSLRYALGNLDFQDSDHLSLKGKSSATAIRRLPYTSLYSRISIANGAYSGCFDRYCNIL